MKVCAFARLPNETDEKKKRLKRFGGLAKTLPCLQTRSLERC